MTQVAKKILVTCALPYANGSIHLGHMLEHIQLMSGCYQRMRGHEVNFICADDAHGTPIMLKAQQLGITPEQMIGEMSQSTRPISPVLILATTTTTQRTATRIASCPS